MKFLQLHDLDDGSLIAVNPFKISCVYKRGQQTVVDMERVSFTVKESVEDVLWNVEQSLTENCFG